MALSCLGESQHLLQAESRRVQAGAGEHEALHPGHRPGPLLPQQGADGHHPQGGRLQLGRARSQVVRNHVEARNIIEDDSIKPLIPSRK